MASSSQLKLGWIGTGVMGKHMAHHLMGQGHAMMVYDIYEEKA